MRLIKLTIRHPVDDSQVVPYAEQKSMSKERTFDKDIMNMTILHQTLISMVDQLAYELRKDGRLAG
jgi:DNA polymerase-4